MSLFCCQIFAMFQLFSKMGYSRHEAEKQRRYGAIPLPRPFRKHEALRTLLPDERTKITKDQKRQSRRQGVDNQTLHTGNGRDFRICEQDSRTKSCPTAK